MVNESSTVPWFCETQETVMSVTFCSTQVVFLKTHLYLPKEDRNGTYVTMSAQAKTRMALDLFMRV